MILHDAVDYLSSGGGWVGGTDLFASVIPPAPETALAVYETGGLSPVHTMGNTAGQARVERPRLQVVSRSASYETARANAQKAWRLLDQLPYRLINGTRYHYAQAVQSPFLFGRDAQDRFLVAFNVDVLKDVSSTS